MPHEMIVALTIIFLLFLVMIARIVWLHIKEKKKERKYINRVKNMEGGRSMEKKYFNGRFVWR